MCLCGTDRHGELPNFLQVKFVEEEAVDTGALVKILGKILQDLVIFALVR